MFKTLFWWLVVALFSVFIFFIYINISQVRETISPSSSILVPIIKPTSTSISKSTVTIGLMGDLGLGRYITSIARSKNDFGWSFSQISPWLKQNDFNLANLESPIIKDCPTGQNNTFIFCGDTRFLPYLKENKFIFNIANNHILNYGNDGLSQTEQYLTQNNIDFVYSHQPETEFTTKTINGISFGFLGYDLTRDITLEQRQLTEDIIISNVKKYNSKVDWLIVSLHWGTEYQPQPESWKVDFAHRLVDAGADIIAGHHPHVYQNEEIYKNKPIFYSLGNFIFDQNWSLDTSQSKIIRINLNKSEILNITKFPITIKYSSQPQLVDYKQ
jgi:poly-gamma-glutamate synthesis protein (capsule biosynthesis protein)